MSTDTYLLFFITASVRAEGEAIARALVTERLAACVNIVPAVHSIFRWEGKLVDEDEVLLLVKSSQAAFARLEARVGQLHSYDVPEIIAVDLARASQAYQAFLGRNIDPEFE